MSLEVDREHACEMPLVMHFVGYFSGTSVGVGTMEVQSGG
jgi:hypothetical protein